jgi:ankyrin repeat protein
MDAIVAARYNSVWQLKRSLQAGADPNTIDRFQMTPLLYAIKVGSDQSVETLLEHGVDLNAIKYHPLIFAIKERVSSASFYKPIEPYKIKQQECIIKLLLKYGADVHAIDNNGMTTLMYVVEACLDALLLPQLLQTVNICDNLKRTALHLAVNSQKCIEVLLKYGAQINVVDQMHKTPLMYAKRLNTIQLLLAEGADVTVVDVSGKTALMYAIQQNNIEVTEALLNAKSDINAVDNSNTSTLMYAVKSVEITRLLLDRGADATLIDSYGKTAFQHAIYNHNVGVVNLLIRRGAIRYAADFDLCFNVLRDFYADDLVVSGTIVNGDYSGLSFDLVDDDESPFRFETTAAENLQPKICFNCTDKKFCNDCWDGTCFICYTEKCFSDHIVKLWCGHILCKDCYDTWRIRSPLCPYCKSKTQIYTSF